jgi:zinc/manganese transport system permease protein
MPRSPALLRSVSKLGAARCISSSSAIVVLNLVGGFQALGTLLSVGLMMLPAAASALLVESRGKPCASSPSASAWSPAQPACLLSYHAAAAFRPGDHPFAAGAIYFLSILVGSRGVIATRAKPHRHRTA